MLGSDSVALRRGWFLDGRREAWDKEQCLTIEGMLRKPNFSTANDLCQDSGFQFFQTIVGWCLDPKAMSVDECDTWMTAEEPGSKSDAWWRKWWFDSKSKFLESKQSCKAKDLSKTQFSTLSSLSYSRSMVSAKVREVRQSLQRAVMLGDESDDEREERWSDVTRDSSQKRFLTPEAILWC